MRRENTLFREPDSAIKETVDIMSDVEMGIYSELSVSDLPLPPVRSPSPHTRSPLSDQAKAVRSPISMPTEPLIPIRSPQRHSSTPTAVDRSISAPVLNPDIHLPHQARSSDASELSVIPADERSTSTSRTASTVSRRAVPAIESTGIREDATTSDSFARAPTPVALAEDDSRDSLADTESRLSVVTVRESLPVPFADNVQLGGAGINDEEPIAIPTGVPRWQRIGLGTLLGTGTGFGAGMILLLLIAFGYIVLNIMAGGWLPLPLNTANALSIVGSCTGLGSISGGVVRALTLMSTRSHLISLPIENESITASVATIVSMQNPTVFDHTSQAALLPTPTSHPFFEHRLERTHRISIPDASDAVSCEGGSEASIERDPGSAL